MNILFIHRSFPGQFIHLAREFAKDSSNSVVFITNKNDAPEMDGVKKYIYHEEAEGKCQNLYLETFNEAVNHGRAVAKLLSKLKQQGYRPDLIYGFSAWGSSMFVKEIYQDVPFVCYFEWFGNSKDSVFDFDGTNLSDDDKIKIKCNNSHILANLCYCDGGLSPTKWQKNMFPKNLQGKIKVIHDGIDTNLCIPDENAKFIIKEKNLTLTSQDEIITYGTRGMEPYRGFPEFMRAVEKLQKLRPEAHFIIAGFNVSCYSPKLTEGSYKEIMLRELDIDTSRVHFVGALPYEKYINLLQVSTAHVYLTYPFILSWSILDAMAVGCCVVASDTKPVAEVVQDNYNGLLVDFFDVEQLIKKIEYAIQNRHKLKDIRENARNTIIERYSLKKVLPQHIAYLKSFIEE